MPLRLFCNLRRNLQVIPVLSTMEPFAQLRLDYVDHPPRGIDLEPTPRRMYGAA
jgi:hypothetical protein